MFTLKIENINHSSFIDGAIHPRITVYASTEQATKKAWARLCKFCAILKEKRSTKEALV
jgi:hypothetical protein